MREILFRGKNYDGEWEQGSLHTEYGETTQDGKREIDYRILGMRGECRYVIPETIGQYTGLTDKNGNKVFEGDILKFTDEEYDYEWIGMVEFGNPNAEYNWGFQLVYIKGAKPNTDILLWFDMEEMGACGEVIGNIQDNLELLESEVQGE